ncbi:hypothetical protein [Tessaracoccus sp. Z1128]
MPFREQPADAVYTPPGYRQPEYDHAAEVTPLADGGYIVWQEPDRLAVFLNRAALMTARELATVDAPPVVARDVLKLLHAPTDQTYTVAGEDLTETIRSWYG